MMGSHCACACLAVAFSAGLVSGEFARLARGFREVVRVFDTSIGTVDLLGAFVRIAFILEGGLGGGTGVFVRLDVLVAVVPTLDLVAILLSKVSAKMGGVQK